MDLNAPLGMGPPQDQPPPRRRRRLSAWAGIVGGLVAAGALAAAALFLFTADPHGGEPYGVAGIEPAAPKPARQIAPPRAVDPTPTGSLPPSPRITDLPRQPVAPASQLAAASGAAPSGPLVIDVAKVLAERRQQSDAPRATLVAPTPMEPQVAPPLDASGDQPKIAILVAGMGLSQTATRTATEIMPAAVTFAFVPYVDRIDTTAAAAKAKGHEVLLQMPMQDAGVPAPGPHALHAGEPAPEVAVDAAWAFGRFSGYSGVSNFLGAPVTSDKPVMVALLRAIGARELFYVDDGTSRRSLGPALAQAQGVAAARADIVLDATADPAAVRANLEALAGIAKRKGSAIGLASGLPDHLAAIAAFAAGLRARDIALVPVGALVAHNSSVAVAR